jgi:nicotinate phosphoribosyltransferase
MPIIKSLLDLDFYKLTMGHLVWKQYPNIPVKYAFKNRTKDVKIGKVIPEAALRIELDSARQIKLTLEECRYLHSLKLFQPEYITWLCKYQLPEYNLNYLDNGDISFEVEGPWSTTIYWETIALSIINELYYATLFPYDCAEREEVIHSGFMNFMLKKEKLANYRNADMHFSDFGTRRRFSQGQQEYIVQSLNTAFPDMFLGTSNVDLARKYDIKPIGTMAHEMFMVMSRAAYPEMLERWKPDQLIKLSHYVTLEDWNEMYGYDLSIALTDTYGSDYFFKSMTLSQASRWRGLRQDSGDPIEFGEKAIKFYEDYGIDPKVKLIVFSDGLDVDKIIEIYEHFKGRIQTSFGWGTNLTNDMNDGSNDPRLKPLSLVIKAVEANGYGLVKLSDNLAKAIGNPEDIERYKRIFGYTGGNYEECKY